MNVINECLLCASTYLVRLKGYEEDHLVRCKSCNFVFSGLVPTAQEVEAVYSAYTRESHLTNISRHKMLCLAYRLLELTGGKGAVLDIGCGNGDYLEIFKELGCEVYGTEFDEKSVSLCREKGIHMLNGGVLPDPISSDVQVKFDIVIFTEVIEHINNPVEVIGNILKLLKSGGQLYITTPNFSSLERRILGSDWGMIKYPEHISYYSPATLHKLLADCGLEKISLYTENISVFRFVQYLKLRGFVSATVTSESASGAAQAAFASKFGSKIKYALNKLLNVTGLGTSLVAIYKSP